MVIFVWRGGLGEMTGSEVIGKVCFNRRGNKKRKGLLRRSVGQRAAEQRVTGLNLARGGGEGEENSIRGEGKSKGVLFRGGGGAKENEDLQLKGITGLAETCIYEKNWGRAMLERGDSTIGKRRETEKEKR